MLCTLVSNIFNSLMQTIRVTTTKTWYNKMFREHINTGVVKCCTFLMVHCKAKHKKLIWFTPPALNVIINFFFWNSFNRTVLQHFRCLL